MSSVFCFCFQRSACNLVLIIYNSKKLSKIKVVKTEDIVIK